MKGVERMNVMILRGQGQGIGASRRDLYAIEVDQGRNCYTCRGLGHMAHYYRNQGQKGRVAEERRVEYEEERIKGIYEQLSNLKEVKNLEFLN